MALLKPFENDDSVLNAICTREPRIIQSIFHCYTLVPNPNQSPNFSHRFIFWLIEWLPTACTQYGSLSDQSFWVKIYLREHFNEASKIQLQDSKGGCSSKDLIFDLGAW